MQLTVNGCSIYYYNSVLYLPYPNPYLHVLLIIVAFLLADILSTARNYGREQLHCPS